MSVSYPNRFLDAHNRARVAVFTSARFPAEYEFAFLKGILRLGDEHDLDLRFFHSAVPDELRDEPEVERLLQCSMTAPVNAPWNDADRAWFERTSPAAVKEVFAAYAECTGMSPDEAWSDAAIRAAFTMARLAQAWGADLLISQGHFESAAAASIGRVLLNKPRVHAVHAPPCDALLSRLWPWNAAQSDLLLHTAEMRPLIETVGGSARAHPLEDNALGNRITALCDEGAPAHDAQHSFAVVREAAPRQANAARPFLVLGAERTGSNMLVGMLAGHAQIKSYGELFNPRLINENVIDGVLPEGADVQQLLDMRKRDPGAFHAELVRLATGTRTRAVGFKLLYYHGCINDALVEYLTSTPDLRVVHLRRRDRLARWVSHQRASASDSWFARRSSTRNETHAQTVSLHLGEMLNDFLMQEQQEERGDATFGHLPLLQICYEDLATAPQRVSKEVLEFLDVPSSELEIHSRKTGKLDPRVLIENWEELEQGLQRTPWRRFAEAP